MNAAGPRLAPPAPQGSSAPRRLLRFGRRRLGAVRRVRPTVEGWIFLATSLAVSLAALNTGNNLLYLVFAAMLSLVALSGVLSESAVRRVRVRRALTERAFAGRLVQGTWLLENPRRWMPHLALRLDELKAPDADLEQATGAEVPWIPAGATEQVRGAWRFSRRGRHRLRGVRVSTAWPFGIFRKWYDLDVPLDVLVLPTPIDRGLTLPSAGQLGGLTSSDRGGGRGDLRELRPWREGEDVRLIHWRTSARRDREIVVDREQEDAGHVEVVLESPAGPDRAVRFEHAISEATGIILRAAREGRGLRLCLPDGPPLQGRGEPAVGEMLRRLATLRLPPGAE